MSSYIPSNSILVFSSAAISGVWSSKRRSFLLYFLPFQSIFFEKWLNRKLVWLNESIVKLRMKEKLMWNGFRIALLFHSISSTGMRLAEYCGRAAIDCLCNTVVRAVIPGQESIFGWSSHNDEAKVSGNYQISLLCMQPESGCSLPGPKSRVVQSQ